MHGVWHSATPWISNFLSRDYPVFPGLAPTAPPRFHYPAVNEIEFAAYIAKFERLADRYNTMLFHCRALIKKHGVLRNIKENVDGTYSFPDYLLLCLTKAAKSLHSVSVLIGLPYQHGEDALVLTRAAYECYIQISYLLADPDRTDSLVAGRVGVSAGRLIRHRSKIIDRETRTEIATVVGVTQMAAQTRWPEDQDVHRFLYPFLCSYAHMHIATLDAYRDGYRLTIQSPNKIFQAGLYAFYCGCLILNEFLAFKALTSRERRKIASFLRGSARAMDTILKQMRTPEGGREVPRRFRQRIRALGQIDR
ncbi:MAG: hypothetical protein QOC70_1786 [Verrucomicrobiota bacterium]